MWSGFFRKSQAGSRVFKTWKEKVYKHGRYLKYGGKKTTQIKNFQILVLFSAPWSVFCANSGQFRLSKICPVIPDESRRSPTTISHMRLRRVVEFVGLMLKLVSIFVVGTYYSPEIIFMSSFINM